MLFVENESRIRERYSRFGANFPIGDRNELIALHKCADRIADEKQSRRCTALYDLVTFLARV